MRLFSALMLLGVFVSSTLAAPAAGPAGRPKPLDRMTVEELREEAHRLTRDDVPYVKYIREINTAADEAWPKLKDSEQFGFTVHVYWKVVDSLRLLTGNFALPQNLLKEPFDPKYTAAMELASVMQTLKFQKPYREFCNEVFASEPFQNSPSVYRDAVIDLWRRHEKARRAVPYSALLALNQPGMGHSGASTWMNELTVGDLYESLGEHALAADWYAKVPPEGLGPLKAADALFAAGKMDKAAEQYRDVLSHLHEWAARQPKLRDTAIAEPLESANLQEVRKHVEGRLAEIDRRK